MRLTTIRIGPSYLEYQIVRSNLGLLYFKDFYGVKIPDPKEFRVSRYIYVPYLWVMPKERGKGISKKMFELLFLRLPNDAYYIRLVHSTMANGMVLKNYLERSRFDWYEVAPNYLAMFRCKP